MNIELLSEGSEMVDVQFTRTTKTRRIYSCLSLNIERIEAKLCNVLPMILFLWTILMFTTLILIMQITSGLFGIVKHGEWMLWHSNHRMNQMLRQLRYDHDDICAIHMIGITPMGSEMYYIEISDNVTVVNYTKPEIRFDGGIHAQEFPGRELLLRFAFELVSRYESGDPETVNLLKSARIFIAPSLNPDGYPLYRGNKNGVDLNRNFPDPQIFINKNESTLEPETRMIMKFIRSHYFVASISIHTGTVVVAYPWSGWPEGSTTPRPPLFYLGPANYEPHPTPDDATMRLAARTYASNNPVISSEICRFADKITNGASWYVTYGESQEWDYGERGTIAITAEITADPLPWGLALWSIWQQNDRSLYEFAKFAYSTGIRGQVFDVTTGNPVMGAKIVTSPGSPAIETGRNGHYSKPLAPGNYTVSMTYGRTMVRYVEIPTMQTSPIIVNFVL